MPPTAVAFGFTLWQLEYSPRAQNQHVPQKMVKGTMTWSPRLRFRTSEPTSSTTPTNSCPNVVPTRVSGIIPWYRCRSDPQIAASVTRTIASPGCSIAGTSFSSTRILYGPRYTIARTAPPSDGPSAYPGPPRLTHRGRAACDDRVAGVRDDVGHPTARRGELAGPLPAGPAVAGRQALISF